MGLIDRLLGRKRREPDGSSGEFSLAIVGEASYQSALRRARASGTLQDDDGRPVLVVRVKCEPSNQYDSNAVLVQTMGGSTLGYLARPDAARYCAAIGAVGGSVLCRARLHGGTEGKLNIGVWIDLCEPDGIVQ